MQDKDFDEKWRRHDKLWKAGAFDNVVVYQTKDYVEGGYAIYADFSIEHIRKFLPEQLSKYTEDSRSDIKQQISTLKELKLGFERAIEILDFESDFESDFDAIIEQLEDFDFPIYLAHSNEDLSE